MVSTHTPRDQAIHIWISCLQTVLYHEGYPLVYPKYEYNSQMNYRSYIIHRHLSIETVIYFLILCELEVVSNFARQHMIFLS